MENARQDTVRWTKCALNRLGYYIPDDKNGMTDEVDAVFTDALYAYQRKSAISFNDTNIGSGSTTERILLQDIAAQDDAALYIWRTVGDSKVRGEHAARNGQRFAWSNPPSGENPGEDYNCRCWTEPVVAPYHPWIEWARERRELRAKLAPPLGMTNHLITSVPLDAINPVYPIETLLGIGFGATGTTLTGRAIAIERAKTQALKVVREAAARNTDWIGNADIRQIQHTFDKAIQFGVKGNWSKKNGEEFKAALQKHVRSPDTKIVNGEYHTNKVTHYYNPNTKLNVIQNQKGEFVSGWKLNKGQVYHIENGGKLGGSAK